MKKITLILLTLILSATEYISASEPVDTCLYLSETKHIMSICIPDDYDSGTKYALIIGLHYCGGNSAEYRQALEPLCDSLNIIIACPDNFTEQVKNPDLITIAIDSVVNQYNIDTTQIFLTGMSCNGEIGLKYGLEKIYPFKGVFVWAPYVNNVSGSFFNFDSDMPVVISIGTADSKYTSVLKLYDSLKAHQPQVDLIILPQIGHTLNFPSFADEMIHSMYFLNDTNAITLNDVENFSMMDTDPPLEVKIKLSYRCEEEPELSVQSSNTGIVSTPSITITEGDTLILTIDPVESNKSGSAYITLQAYDDQTKAMEQTIFKVSVEHYVSSSELIKESSISVYPVPARDYIYIKSDMRRIDGKIIDIQGKVMMELSNFNTDVPVNISALQTGLYVLLINDNGKQKIVSFMVE